MFESTGMTCVSIRKTDSYDIISLVDIHGCWHWSTLEYCNVPAYWKCPLWLHNCRSRMISKGSFWRTSHTKVDQARTSFAKKLGMKLATTYISNPFKFQWIQMILWCPKARGDPQVFPSSHGWDSPLYLPWTITSKSTSTSKSPHIPFFWLWSRQLLWTFQTFWDEEIPGTLRKELKDWNLEADCQPQLNKLKCVRLM